MARHYRRATRRAAPAAAERGIEIVVWTADNPAWVRRATERRVRAIITNDPSRLREKGRSLMGDGT
jgi:glycerophosphoryl diester phosphodiesterase